MGAVTLSFTPEQIVQVPIERLIPYARNARTHDDRQVADLAASLREFGWTNPVLIDAQGGIIAGHGRVLAARQLGITAIPCIELTHLTDLQRRAYILADNQLALKAGWDLDLLTTELAALRAADFSLDLTGFDAPALADLQIDVDALTRMDEAEPGSDGDTEPDIDRAEELRVKWGVESGMMFALGDHRLLCGDSTKAEDVGRLLQGDKPHLMVTDPPYGVEYDAEWRKVAMPDTNPGKTGGMYGKVSNDDRSDWREAWALFPGEVCYVWHGSTRSPEVAVSLTVCGFVLRNLIVWAKNNHVISRGNYHHKHEPCWYAVRKNGTGHWQGDRNQNTLWEISSNKENETGHSTQKPLECMARPIRNNSAEGDLIYEPFSGSGTTIIAGENLGRKVRACEISPAYVAVALERYHQHTGKTPVKV